MYKYIKCTMMLGGQYSLVGLCPVWLYFGLFVAVVFSSPVPQSCLLPPEIFFAKNHLQFTCSMSCDKESFIFIFNGLKMNVNSYQLPVGGSVDSDVWTWAYRPFWHFPTMHLGLSCGAWVHAMTWGWTTTNMNNWRCMVFFFKWGEWMRMEK